MVSGTKKPFYKYENELRIMIKNQFTSEIVNEKRRRVPKYNKGVNIKVELSTLIDSIILSPYCEEWFIQLVKDFSYNIMKINKNIKIKNSEIKESI